MLQRQMNIEGELKATQFIREAAERSLSITLAPSSDKKNDLAFGSGRACIQEVQPGLRCELHDLNCHSDMEFECSAESQIMCSITLDGHLDGIEIAGFGMTESPLNRGTVLGFDGPISWIRRVYKDQYFKSLCVSLQASFFERFANDFDNHRLDVLESLQSGLNTEVLPRSKKLISLGNLAFDHSYSGGLATLHQESNTLQFLLEIVRLLSEENKLIDQIGRSHYDRLMHARSILDNSLLNPPTTLDLARTVGTNITTLQAHFKMALNTTIFGYVKSQRLEMARVLLIEHKLTVSESAFRVGFSSPSAFTASYRKYFGHPPSAEMR